MRPTADRARQAMFNVLEHAPWSAGLEGRRVIDAFAGSGALGLEALSRGASVCLFVDHDPAARAAIRASLRGLRLEGRGRVTGAELPRLPRAIAADAADLVFVDPPYAAELAEPTLAALTSAAWLADGALAVVEREAAAAEVRLAGWRLLDHRHWGAARVDFLQFAAGGA